MISKITIDKLSIRNNNHNITVTPINYDPKTQRLLVSLNNKVAETILNEKTGNLIAKIEAPIVNSNNLYTIIVPDVRVKVFVYDFINDKILGAKLQEFKFNLQQFEYEAIDELLTTSPLIIGDWDQKTVVSKAYLEQKMILVFNNNQWIVKYHQSTKGSELVDFYRKYDDSLAKSTGTSDNVYDLMFYIETDYNVNLGKVLLIKMSNAMIDFYSKSVKENSSTNVIKEWSEQIYNLNKNKDGFTATINDIEKAFLLEIRYRPLVNKGTFKYTNSEVTSIISSQLSKKIRAIKIDRENWDPTLKSDRYKLKSYENGINYISSTLNDFKNEVTIYRNFLAVISSYTPKNVFLDSCISLLKSFEDGISFIAQIVLSNKENNKAFFAYLCGIINGVFEFICGIIDVIFLLLELIISTNLKEEPQYQLDFLQLREGLEECIEAWLKDPEFLSKEIENMINAYDYARYKDPKLTVYQIAHNTGEDLVLTIDIILSFIAIVKALTNSSKYLPKFTEWIDEVVERNPRISRKIDWLSSGFFKFGNDGKTFRNFTKLQQRVDDGWYNILCHGEGKRVIIDGRKYKAEDFAKKLLVEGYEKGNPIRLIACETGSKPNGFASQLAKILETKVIAPTEKIRVDDFGEFIIDKKGKFVEFNK